ncbi:hypothetical protein SLA2020_034140 [Shorea laevis]
MDDSILAILRILKNEGEVHLYVDHAVNFADVIDLVLSISWKDAIVNEGGGVGVDSNNNEEPLEADRGNVTIERQGLHEDNFDNSHKEFDSEYESLSDEDLGSPTGTDDEEYLTHLHSARALRKKRRARSRVEKGLTCNTQARSRKIAPKSTPTRSSLTLSTPTRSTVATSKTPTRSTPTRVKHVVRKPTLIRAKDIARKLTTASVELIEQPSVGEATQVTEQPSVNTATPIIK